MGLSDIPDTSHRYTRHILIFYTTLTPQVGDGMRTNKGLGREAVLSLSRAPDVVKHRDVRERLIEVLALIGWLWMLWHLFSQNVQFP